MVKRRVVRKTAQYGALGRQTGATGLTPGHIKAQRPETSMSTVVGVAASSKHCISRQELNKAAQIHSKPVEMTRIFHLKLCGTPDPICSPHLATISFSIHPCQEALLRNAYFPLSLSDLWYIPFMSEPSFEPQDLWSNSQGNISPFPLLLGTISAHSSAPVPTWARSALKSGPAPLWSHRGMAGIIGWAPCLPWLEKTLEPAGLYVDISGMTHHPGFDLGLLEETISKGNSDTRQHWQQIKEVWFLSHVRETCDSYKVTTPPFTSKAAACSSLLPHSHLRALNREEDLGRVGRLCPQP